MASQTGMWGSAREWARRTRLDVVALYIAMRDTRTPALAKVVSLAVVGYALSPIDLIPDFIPVIGYLDDLLIVPLGILLAVRLVPASLMVEFRALAKSHGRLPRNMAGAVAVICIWLVAMSAAGWWAYHAIKDNGLLPASFAFLLANRI
ncbi:MAG: YkvA family protein [Nitratireductor sp.]